MGKRRVISVTSRIMRYLLRGCQAEGELFALLNVFPGVTPGPDEPTAPCARDAGLIVDFLVTARNQPLTFRAIDSLDTNFHTISSFEVIRKTAAPRIVPCFNKTRGRLSAIEIRFKT